MEKKYELTNESIEYAGRKLYRIKALKNFRYVKKGNIGGYVESERNLSQEGNCWIYDNAKVFGDARVYGNAIVYDNAEIYGISYVYGDSIIHGNAKICDAAKVHDNAEIFGDAEVFDAACICGDAEVCETAKVYGSAVIRYGTLTTDIKDDLIQYIACSLNVYPLNGKYYLYKRVNKIKEGIYKSLYDSNFIYKDGEIVEAKNYDEGFDSSCGKGIYVSTPFYWSNGDTLIIVEVDINDIISCMAGQLRCKRVKVLGEVKK